MGEHEEHDNCCRCSGFGASKTKFCKLRTDFEKNEQKNAAAMKRTMTGDRIPNSEAGHGGGEPEALSETIP